MSLVRSRTPSPRWLPRSWRTRLPLLRQSDGLTREVLARSESAASYTRKYMVPLGAMLRARVGNDEEAIQSAISVFGAVAAYFLVM